NVLHATPNIRRSLRHAKAALKRGGVLLLHELSGKSLYTHLTFGLLEGWWLYEDGELRVPGAPALTPASWQAVLEEVGFRAIHFPHAEAHVTGLQVVVAQSDGIVRQPQAIGVDTAVRQVAAKSTASVPAPLPPQVKQPVNASLLRNKCTAYVANLVGKTLGI